MSYFCTKMIPKHGTLIFFYFCFFELWLCSLTDDTCKDKEIIIKSVDLYQTYVFNIYQLARLGFKANRSLYGIKLDYNYPNFFANVSSWLQAFESDGLNDVAYSQFELPLTDVEKEKHPEVLAVPTMIGALAIVYNLPNVTSLNLTMDSIIDIYLGKITKWNHVALQLVNPGLQLPDKPINVTANMQDAYFLDSFFLTNIFATYSNEFKKAYGVVDFNIWPNKSSYTSPTLVSAQLVNRTLYSIGYMTMNNIILYGLTTLKQAIICTPLSTNNNTIMEAIQSSAATIFNENGNQMIKSTLNQGLLNKLTYPFLYFHYVVINRTTSPNVSCCAMQETVGMLEFFLDSTLKNPSDLTKVGYYPLPKNIYSYVKSSMIASITCNGTVAVKEFEKYFIESSTTVIVDSSINVLAICLSLLALLILVSSSFIFYNKRVQLAKEKFWFVKKEELVLEEEKQKLFESTFSIGTLQSERSIQTEMNKRNELNKMFRKYNIIKAHWNRNESDVLLKRLALPQVSDWNRKTKLLVSIFIKNINHANLCSLHGITTLDDRPHSISQFCSKGSLNYVLMTSPYHLSNDIKFSLAADIASGLRYLHQKNITHRNLSSLTCYVDNVWNVKLFDWANASLLSSENVKPSVINTDTLEDEECLINLLYSDPNLLSYSKHSEGSTETQSYTNVSALLAADLYSYGMLLVEIFTRKLPFSEEVEHCANTYPDIIRDKMNKIHCVPATNIKEVPHQIQILVEQMTGPLNRRPDIYSVVKELHQLRGKVNKSIVDIMMETMENYVEDLEEKVIERTSELTEITNQMRELLYELLPPQIATKFIKMETIEPEFYECITILFSDIVGFTIISSRSTPLQVMSFLNEIWTIFDKTLERFDTYKVDTIGDAYMVASGLPKRNGVEHCKQIADLALALKEESRSFFIHHLPSEKAQIRMGINSGPVTAGIVGRKMPQYCIFGDTVNTASRMESSSLPLKIHVSEYSAKLILQYYPTYDFEYRGEIEIKGKGTMKTYWLLGLGD